MGDTRIVFWNAQTLTGKIRMLTDFLREQNVDMMLVSETHLHKNTKLKVPNYHIYRQDEVTPAGVPYRGLAVMVHRRIIHQPIPAVQFQSLQALGVLIQVAGRNRRIFAVYKPPNLTLDTCELRKMLDSETPTIIAGDLNSKHTYWNSSRVCPNGKKLYQDSVDHDYAVAGPTTWTHHDRQGGDVLDVAVYQGLNSPPTLTTLPDLPSDHRPVMMTIQEPPSRIAAPERRRKICWETYRRETEERLITRPISTAEDVEVATESLTTAIQESLTAATITTSTSGQRLDPLPRWIRDLIKEKRDTRKTWQDAQPSNTSLINLWIKLKPP